MPAQVSDAFWAEVQQDHHAVVRLGVYSSAGAFQEYLVKAESADQGVLVSGSVDVDESRASRRTLSSQIAVDPDNNLIPVLATDLLHPSAGNELRVERGVAYRNGGKVGTFPVMSRTGNVLALGRGSELVFADDRVSGPNIPQGTTVTKSVPSKVTLSATPTGEVQTVTVRRDPYEFAVMGVFRCSKPTITFDPASGLVKIAMTGLDRSSAISRTRWNGVPYRVAAGLNLTNVTQDAIAYLAPWLSLPFKLSPSGYYLPKTVWGIQKSQSIDPWADLQKANQSGAMELFFDTHGIPTSQPTVDSSTISPLNLTFLEGETATVTKAERILDETKTHNGVILRCHSYAGEPLTVTIWDEDPTSPTYVGGDWGKAPLTVDMSHIAAEGQTPTSANNQAVAAAKAMFRKVCRAMDEISIDCVPNPAIHEGDAFQVASSTLGIDDTYVASTLTIPLDIEDGSGGIAPMSIGCRPHRQVVN